jgi:hypothetical protein
MVSAHVWRGGLMAQDPRYDGNMAFIYEKGAYFRVIHADGVIGGISPGTGLVNMSVFSERSPIPKKVVHSVSHGVVGPEIMEKREIREGLFREVEADLVMSVEVAIALRGWLDDRIKEIQTVRETIASSAASEGKVKQ